MDTQNNNLPFKANEVVNILQAAPGILTDNETRVTRCSNAGKSLLDTINATNGINSDEVDGQVQKFIEASKQTLKRINGSRTPITQMLTAISKRFTSLESEIDVKTSGTIPLNCNGLAMNMQLKSWKNRKNVKRKLVESS